MKRLARSSTSACVESLEPRLLFSLYGYQSVIDHLGLTDPVHDLAAPDDGSQGFGAAVAGLGDIDGDGYADFAVAAPGTDSASAFGVPGRVFIYSGHDAHLIRTLTDNLGGFGVSLANVGDVNNDGVPDLLVGSPWLDATDDDTSNPTGGVYVYSGSDGSLIRMFTGDTERGEFGRVVVRAEDINEDGVAEMVIGAPAAGGDEAGRVYVFSGGDGSLLHTLNGETAGDRFGAAIATAPAGALQAEVDAYVAVGAPDWGAGHNGRVFTYGTDGVLLYTLDGGSAEGHFGAALATQRYVTAILDEYLLYVGIPGADTSSLEDTGAIRYFRLGDGQLQSQFFGDAAGDRLGGVLTNVGDMNADGSDDLMTAAHSGGGLSARYLITGMFGLNFQATPPIGPHDSAVPVLGAGFGAAGDVNGDGFPDLISGDGAGRVTVVSSIAIGEEVVIEGASPDLRNFWAQNANRQFVVLDGQVLAYSVVTGLIARQVGSNPQPYSQIQAILNDGTIVFNNAPSRALMVLADGTVTPLEMLVTSVVGGETPDFGTLSVVKAGSGGHLLLTDDAERVWMYFDGVLTFVWRGTGNDINATGAVAGMERQEDSSLKAALWIPGSAPVLLTGLDSAGAINDDNVVVGMLSGTGSFLNPGHLATWNDGMVTDLAAGPDVSTTTIAAHWVYRGFDTDGRVLVDVVTNGYRSPDTYTAYLYDPEDGLRPLSEAVVAFPDGWATSMTRYPYLRVPATALGPADQILASSALLTVVDAHDAIVFRNGSPTATLSTAVGQFVAGINAFNGLEVFLNVGTSGWTARRLGNVIEDVEHASIALFLDRDPTNVYVALAADGEVRVFALLPMAPGLPTEVILSTPPGRTPIVRGMTTFTNEQGVVHLAGIDANDDVVIYYRQPQFNTLTTNGWSFNNLTDDHLQPQGLTLPVLVGSLTAFSTTWSGMNINGLDAEGHVHTVWWAPGMTLWYTNDLTAETGTSALHGQLTSYATAWGTLHMTGLNDDGDVTTVWWAPGFGPDWRADVLVPGGTALAADSLTSYVTPWGGLNIAGRDAATGRVVVYWWSPESNRWQAETLSLRDGVESPELRGALSASVSTDGVMAIGAADAAGNVQRFSWRPGDNNLWTLEDLTGIVSG
jgi:hypothetical protein